MSSPLGVTRFCSGTFEIVGHALRVSGDPPEIVLVRHGETEWTLSGRHTGRTDIPLTERGREQARALAAELSRWQFALVLTSPLARANETCRLAGLGEQAQEREELMEWDYGDYEGRTTPEIRREHPGWTLWRDGVPNGETEAEVRARVDRVSAELRSVAGDAAVFAHGHMLRVLAARWLGLEPEAGRLFALDPASISVLGYERETAVVRLWNRS
jgi:probable phosphoglycerate mutase